MSITKELRKWAEDNTLQDTVLTTYPPQHAVHGVLETLLRIADRIDVEYEKAVASVMNDALYHANEKDMAEFGWIPLPLDANGERIRIGDVMECLLDGVKQVLRVGYMTYRPDGWHIALTIEDNFKYQSYASKELRHYHAPTVEDVLREFYSRYCITKPKNEDDAILAEYATKLRLAGDGE